MYLLGSISVKNLLDMVFSAVYLVFVLNVLVFIFLFFLQYIPCNARTFLAEYIEEQRDEARILQFKKTKPKLLTYEGRSYPAMFKHRANYSKFVGSAWFEFTHDYGLRAGDRIVFTMDHLTFDLKIETYRGGERILPLACAGKLFKCF